MAASQACPLVEIALPHNRAARIATKICLAFLATLVLAASAKAKVVLGPVDMSLQSLVVLLIGASFGARLGVATLVLYLAEGALGFPVFQGTPEKGIGLPYMMGPTGGYLLGYVAMAAIVGWAADRGWDRHSFRLFGAMLVASVVLMALGYAWLAILIGPGPAWVHGVAPFLVAGLVKIALATALVAGTWRFIRVPRKETGR